MLSPNKAVSEGGSTPVSVVVSTKNKATNTPVEDITQDDEYDYTFVDTEEGPVELSVPDEYKGELLLRFSNEPTKINEHIPSYTYRKKEQM